MFCASSLEKVRISYTLHVVSGACMANTLHTCLFSGFLPLQIQSQVAVAGRSCRVKARVKYVCIWTILRLICTSKYIILCHKSQVTSLEATQDKEGTRVRVTITCKLTNNHGNTNPLRWLGSVKSIHRSPISNALNTYRHFHWNSLMNFAIRW